MSAAIALREDFSAADLRALARDSLPQAIEVEAHANGA